MESTIIIKVKHGEMLRRFNARVVDGELDLDMDGLREKVLGLFNLSPDANLKLTYIDEDGDVVAVVDEEDLRDVVRQSLNPLRITVTLNAEKIGKSYARSSGSSTPMISPRVRNLSQNLNTSVSEILKSIPEPFREALTKLSLDMTSKAASSAPALAELIRCFSKMGLSYPSPFSEFQNTAQSSGQSEASGHTISATGTKDPQVSKAHGVLAEVSQSAKVEIATSKSNNKLGFIPTRDMSLHDICDGFASVSANPAPGAFHDDVGNREKALHVSSGTDMGKLNNKKLSECDSSGKYNGLAYVNVTPVAANAPAGDNTREVKKSGIRKSVGAGASTSFLDSLKHSTPDSPSTILGGSKAKPISNVGTSSGSQFGLNSIDKYHLLETALAKQEMEMTSANHSAVPVSRYAPRVFPFKRRYDHSDGICSIFHRGVRCDGCGVHPIAGPRFKSKVKEDYDLCSICFAEMGNVVDYMRMDRPMTYQHSLSSKGLYDPQCWVRPPTLPQVSSGCVMKPTRLKLDSRFVQDVNVLDGTIMAPSTPFTKTWRMRNNGTIIWPQGTQIVWIGGDRISDAFSAVVEIAPDGLPIDGELDIAVNFTAPERPGRYISYWRMASPSGQKFGQRVWVLIQVAGILKEHVKKCFHGLNLNLPPDSSSIAGPQIINANVEPMVEDSNPKPEKSNRTKELKKQAINVFSNKKHELNLPINDCLLVRGGVSSSFPTDPFSVSYPVTDLSEVLAPIVPSPAPYPFSLVSHVAFPAPFYPTVAPPMPCPASFPANMAPPVPSPASFPATMAPPVLSPASFPATGMQVTAEDVGKNIDVDEQKLIMELMEIGFKLVDLDKEILRLNEYDTRQSVVSPFFATVAPPVPSPTAFPATVAPPVPSPSPFFSTVVPPMPSPSPFFATVVPPMPSPAPFPATVVQHVPSPSPLLATVAPPMSSPSPFFATVALPPFLATRAPHVPSPSPFFATASPPVLSSTASFPATGVQATAQDVGENIDVEQTLISKLEMGLKQADLNKEILGLNDYDMVQSVVEVCDVEEWDPILEELQEMGFLDNEMNKRLLKKNSGSIKRVVMDLIAGERA